MNNKIKRYTKEEVLISMNKQLNSELIILEADNPDTDAAEEKRKLKHEEYLKTKTLNRDTLKEALAILELSLRHEDAEYLPNDIKQSIQKICEYYKVPFRIHEKIGPAVINLKGIRNLEL